METRKPDPTSAQPRTNTLPPTPTKNTTPIDGPTYQDEWEEHILVHFNEDIDGTLISPDATQERRKREGDVQNTARAATSKRSSKSQASYLARQKSRRRELLRRHMNLGITLDTSVTGLKVHTQDETRGYGLNKKHSILGLGRYSMKIKGLGITKPTPQPDSAHRHHPNIDRDEPRTTDSLQSDSKTWQDISPWDRPIPIGISVPTDSISDFSAYQTFRQRSGSEATLVTPSIIITPAGAMQSVWSPDTPYTESDYTPSIYSRDNFNRHSVSQNVPPIPALPIGLSNFTGFQPSSKPHPEVTDLPRHSRNDTLDSAGTAFEEDDDLKRRDRIMSTSTFFEEDVTPLRERTIESALANDTPMIRRSQGWWNVITTPFVTTPRSAVWPPNERGDNRTPDVPTLPASFLSRLTPTSPSTYIWSATEKSPSVHEQSSPIPPALHSESTAFDVNQRKQFRQIVQTENNLTTVNQYNINGTKKFLTNADIAVATTQPLKSTPDQAVTSPSMSATPVISTATIGTVVVPRQGEEQPRAINISIELQDRRPDVNFRTVNTNSPPNEQQTRPFSPALRLQGVGSYNSQPQSLPVFAPPPTFSQKGSRFSYDDGSCSSSVGSTPDLKKSKKHRKVFDIMGLFSCSKRKHQNSPDEKKKKKRGWCFWCCGCCLVLVVLLAVIVPVAVISTKNSDEKPTGTQPDQEVGSQWLNLTGYPPIPTGISTIAQPEAVKEQSGCVAPTTLWSCALPKELHESIKPNKPDQPNFKIEITFENSTVANPSKTKLVRKVANPVSAGAFIRSHILNVRSIPSPSPAPPSDQDMKFLGQTTDGNSAPFEGEETPLFVTFQDPGSTASRLLKRTGDDLTNITSGIPPPRLNSDGTAAPANLLPFPSAQPLRLYNRGKDTEHYGFYTYFDRSLFLKSINGENRGGNPADIDGGSDFSAATMRCTFAETRFLVQIWTRSATSKPLLQNTAQDASEAYKRPGTFPYPVTVTIDRHGGNAAKKSLYCYDMESDGTIKNEGSKRFFQFEDRAFGGNLVNGTQGRQGVTGPIDGGSGGCSCQWQNWLD